MKIHIISIHSKSKAKISEPDSSSDDSDNITDEAYNNLVRKFNKLRFRKNSGQGSSSGTKKFKKKSNTFKTGSASKSSSESDFDRAPLSKIRCFECQGWGHYQNECANNLRKEKKNLLACLSDVSDEETKDEDKGHDPVTNAKTLLSSLYNVDEQCWDNIGDSTSK